MRAFQPFTAAQSSRALSTASANGVPVEVGADRLPLVMQWEVDVKDDA